MTDKPSDRYGVPAIVTYIALAIFAADGLILLGMAALKMRPDVVMVGLVSTVIGQAGMLASGATAYWVGASSGGRSANAALAQLAGAGAPPSSTPGGPPDVAAGS